MRERAVRLGAEETVKWDVDYIEETKVGKKEVYNVYWGSSEILIYDINEFARKNCYSVLVCGPCFTTDAPPPAPRKGRGIHTAVPWLIKYTYFGEQVSSKYQYISYDELFTKYPKSLMNFYTAQIKTVVDTVNETESERLKQLKLSERTERRSRGEKVFSDTSSDKSSSPFSKEGSAASFHSSCSDNKKR